MKLGLITSVYTEKGYQLHMIEFLFSLLYITKVNSIGTYTHRGLQNNVLRYLEFYLHNKIKPTIASLSKISN